MASPLCPLPSDSNIFQVTLRTNRRGLGMLYSAGLPPITVIFVERGMQHITSCGELIFRTIHSLTHSLTHSHIHACMYKCTHAYTYTLTMTPIHTNDTITPVLCILSTLLMHPYDKGGQAEDAGVKIGDILLSVNGVDCFNPNLSISQLMEIKAMINQTNEKTVGEVITNYQGVIVSLAVKFPTCILQR